MSDPEWNATVHVLAFLDAHGPGGHDAGDILALVDPERHEIDWEQLIEWSRVWSSGERTMFDVAVSLWSGNATAGAFDPENPKRPLAPLAWIWSGIGDAWFECIIDALRMRRGEPIG